MKRWPWLATLLALAGLSACTAAPSAPPTAAPTPAQASAPSVAFVSFSAGYDSGSVPPPFNYTYALDGTFGADALDVHYVLIYRYRDQVTLKEITSQGYTTHDDIDWTGRLTGATLDTWRSLVGGTTLGPIPPLVPGANSFSVTLTPPNGAPQVGVPMNCDAWQSSIAAIDKQARAETGATRSSP